MPEQIKQAQIRCFVSVLQTPIATRDCLVEFDALGSLGLGCHANMKVQNGEIRFLFDLVRVQNQHIEFFEFSIHTDSESYSFQEQLLLIAYKYLKIRKRIPTSRVFIVQPAKGKTLNSPRLKKTEITTDVDNLSKGQLRALIDYAHQLSGDSHFVDARYGAHCERDSQQRCRYATDCFGLDRKLHILNFKGFKKNTIFHTLNRGGYSILDIPPTLSLNENEKTIRSYTLSGKTRVLANKIKDWLENKGLFLSKRQKRIVFMDFEATKIPYRIHPTWKTDKDCAFQFSLHVLDQKEWKLTHYEFLNEGIEWPNAIFAQKLVKILSGPALTEAAILVFNSGFERKILKELAKTEKNYRKELKEIDTRIIDLMTPFQKRYFYHPKQNGKYTLKSIIPQMLAHIPSFQGRITDSYEAMEINTGMKAVAAYLRLMTPSDENEEIKRNKQRLRNRLLRYCALDTYSMFEILIGLNLLAGERIKIKSLSVVSKSIRC